MNAADTEFYRLAMPEPVCEEGAAATRLSAHQSVSVGNDRVVLLLEYVVDGLLHCACAHHAVHPDLIDWIEQRAQGRAVAQGSQP